MRPGFDVFKRKALAGISALALAVAALTPLPTFADSKGDGGGARGCPLVNERGEVVGYAPVGTLIGLFHCGPDGEWHFGWATTDLTAPTGTLTPGSAAAFAGPSSAVWTQP
jgi:hypothetical protein